jgi:hypothetical protein
VLLSTIWNVLKHFKRLKAVFFLKALLFTIRSALKHSESLKPNFSGNVINSTLIDIFSVNNGLQAGIHCESTFKPTLNAALSTHTSLQKNIVVKLAIGVEILPQISCIIQ